MTETMQTDLREAIAKFSCEGLLAEKNLKVESDNGVNIISGSLTIEISDTDSVQVRVRQAQKKRKNGAYTSEENPIYAGIATVMNDYVSIADGGRENATRVRVNGGQYRPYYSPRADKEVPAYQASFFTRVDAERAVDSFANFELEVYISNVRPETYTQGENQGERTGRAIISGWIPMYGGVISPVELIAPKEDNIAEEVLNGAFNNNSTVIFYGDIVNRKVVKTTKIPVKIGQPKITTTTSYTNEFVITGASEEEAEDKAFNPQVIRAAIEERKQKNEEAKANARSNNGNNNGNAFGATHTATAISASRPLPF